VLTTVTGYTASYNEALNGTGVWVINLVGLRPSTGAVSPPASPKHGGWIF